MGQDGQKHELWSLGVVFVLGIISDCKYRVTLIKNNNNNNGICIAQIHQATQCSATEGNEKQIHLKAVDSIGNYSK